MNDELIDTMPAYDVDEGLEFKPTKIEGGIQAKLFFDNGYGVSVIRNKYTQGYEKGLYELAVLFGNEHHYGVCYDTEITDDVLVNLTMVDVMQVIKQVKGLKQVLESEDE